MRKARQAVDELTRPQEVEVLQVSRDAHNWE